MKMYNASTVSVAVSAGRNAEEKQFQQNHSDIPLCNSPPRTRTHQTSTNFQLPRWGVPLCIL